MKRRKRLSILYVFLAIYLILYQTQYFWAKYLGSIDAFLMLTYAFLRFALLAFWIGYGLWFLAEWTISWKNVVFHMAILAVILLPRFVPGGFIDWENYRSSIRWTAYREGTINCFISIKFREDYSFERLDGCFGTAYREGHYLQKADTLFLTYDLKESGPMDTLIVDFEETVEAKAQLLTGERPLIFRFHIRPKH